MHSRAFTKLFSDLHRAIQSSDAGDGAVLEVPRSYSHVFTQLFSDVHHRAVLGALTRSDEAVLGVLRSCSRRAILEPPQSYFRSCRVIPGPQQIYFQ